MKDTACTSLLYLSSTQRELWAHCCKACHCNNILSIMSSVTTILIACWYYTSSSIAVSSQNIFQGDWWATQHFIPIGTHHSLYIKYIIYIWVWRVYNILIYCAYTHQGMKSWCLILPNNVPNPANISKPMLLHVSTANFANAIVWLRSRSVATRVTVIFSCRWSSK